MRKLYVDEDRYGDVPATPLVEATHACVREMLRQKFGASGDDWRDFVFGSADRLVSSADLAAVERRILATGYRFAWSAMASVRDNPDIYLADPGASATFSYEHPEAVLCAPDAEGREQRGQGDNVFRLSENVTGRARYIRTSETVIELMRNGVPADTIAIIDDSGGTLTAPILEQFKAVICAGGTVRSHLGILTREYGIPCLMNARISGILDGDRVEIETAALARTAEAYQSGDDMSARIWKLPE